MDPQSSVCLFFDNRSMNVLVPYIRVIISELKGVQVTPLGVATGSHLAW